MTLLFLVVVLIVETLLGCDSGMWGHNDFCIFWFYRGLNTIFLWLLDYCCCYYLHHCILIWLGRSQRNSRHRKWYQYYYSFNRERIVFSYYHRFFFHPEKNHIYCVLLMPLFVVQSAHYESFIVVGNTRIPVFHRRINTPLS